MFDIGFWEILLIAVVLLIVIGPERLPDLARQAGFLVRRARQALFRLRQEMNQEMGDSSFSEIDKAHQEMRDLKNDVTQLGKDIAYSAQNSSQQKK